MLRVRRIAGLLAAAVTAALLVGAPSAVSAAMPGGVDDFSFDSYDADLYLTRDESGHSDLRTVETLVARFPSFDQNRGIIRAIPDDYDSVQLDVRVESVTDADGRPVPFTTHSAEGFTAVSVGTDDYVHGVQTYVITYTQRDVVRNFADTASDELYWDINGTGWDQRFDTVTARVHVAPDLVAALSGRQACYVGDPMSSSSCAIERTTGPGGEAVFTSSEGPVAALQTLTMAIGFAPGTFIPGKQLDQDWFVTILPMVLIALIVLGLVGLIVRRSIIWRNAPGRGTIIPQYSVPDGVDLLLASDIIRRPSTGIPATFISFAVRKMMRILDYAPGEASISSAVYTFQLLDATPAQGQERSILVALFGAGLEPGALKTLKKTDTSLARALSAERKAVLARVIEEGYRAKPQKGLASWISWPLFAIEVFAIIVFALAPIILVGTGWTNAALVFAIIGIIAAGVITTRPPLLTPKGAELREYLDGMRVYMELAEQDRFRMLQSVQGADRVDVGNRLELIKLYEKLLPFAVLWGIEDTWAHELAVHYEQDQVQPDWYVSRQGFQAAVFTSAMFRFRSETTAATALPSSTSGSGSGSFSGGSFGGGFAGGGGGGGGGGGR